MVVYLDNSATTRPFKEVVLQISKVMYEDYGNPSSMHNIGLVAEQHIKKAKEIIAKTIKASINEIIFTSGGTESNNLAIIGTALAAKRTGNHIITTNVEHPSVIESLNYLEEHGFRVTKLEVDKSGNIDIEKFKDELTKETILVTMMYVNNEVGFVLPIKEIGNVINEFNKSSENHNKVLFHVDAIQAYGKYQILPKNLNIDLMSVSGHKINGPKGVGFLYIKEKTKIRPTIIGGGQQKGLRSGTENVLGIVGLGEAVKLSYKDFDEKVLKIKQARDYLITKLSDIEDIIIHKTKNSAIHIVSIAIKNIRSEVMLHALEQKGVYVSAGSACASNKPQISHVLKALKIDNELLDKTIRLSLSVETTIEEIDYATKELNDIISKLKIYIRK